MSVIDAINRNSQKEAEEAQEKKDNSNHFFNKGATQKLLNHVFIASEFGDIALIPDMSYVKMIYSSVIPTINKQKMPIVQYYEEQIS